MQFVAFVLLAHRAPQPPELSIIALEAFAPTKYQFIRRNEFVKAYEKPFK